MAKGETDHYEQFHLWPECYQLYLTIKLSFMEIFQVCVTMFSKLSAAYLLYVGKGWLILKPLNLGCSDHITKQEDQYDGPIKLHWFNRT